MKWLRKEAGGGSKGKPKSPGTSDQEYEDLKKILKKNRSPHLTPQQAKELDKEEAKRRKEKAAEKERGSTGLGNKKFRDKMRQKRNLKNLTKPTKKIKPLIKDDPLPGSGKPHRKFVDPSKRNIKKTKKYDKSVEREKKKREKIGPYIEGTDPRDRVPSDRVPSEPGVEKRPKSSEDNGMELDIAEQKKQGLKLTPKMRNYLSKKAPFIETLKRSLYPVHFVEEKSKEIMTSNYGSDFLLTLGYENSVPTTTASLWIDQLKPNAWTVTSGSGKLKGRIVINLRYKMSTDGIQYEKGDYSILMSPNPLAGSKEKKKEVEIDSGDVSENLAQKFAKTHRQVIMNRIVDVKREIFMAVRKDLL